MANCEFAKVSASGRLICYNNGEGDSTESSSPNYIVCPFQKYCNSTHEWILVGGYGLCQRKGELRKNKEESKSDV